MTYGEFLKKLIVFTNTKMMVLANETGYDISYISKWCNKGILPTSRTISIINKKLAKVFTCEILAQDRVDDFCLTFSELQEIEKENLLDDTSSLEKSIEKALDLHYRNASLPEEGVSKTQIPAIEHQKTEYNQVLKKILEHISQIITYAKEDVTILWTMDICQSFLDLNELMPTVTNPDIKVHIMICLDTEEFQQKNFYYMKQLYAMLNRNPSVFFDFYDGKELIGANTVVVKDVCSYLLSIGKNGHLDFSVQITDPKDVAYLYSFFYRKIKQQPLLLNSCNSNELANTSYRTEFYSRIKFYFFTTFGFEFLLPGKTMDHLIETAVEESGCDKIATILRSLQITWEEIFESREIRFFILLPPLLDYITTGEIYYTDIRYHLTIEERMDHLKNVIEIVKKNPKIKFVVLDEDIFQNEFIPKISIFSNDKKAFMKNYVAYETSIGPQLYIIKNREMIRSINTISEALLENTTLVREYNADDLVKLLNEYGNMIYRMMNMKK